MKACTKKRPRVACPSWCSKPVPAKAQIFRQRFGSPAAGIEEQNRRAADIILANAKPGDNGLAVQWAREVLAARPQPSLHASKRRRMIDAGTASPSATEEKKHVE